MVVKQTHIITHKTLCVIKTSDVQYTLYTVYDVLWYNRVYSGNFPIVAHHIQVNNIHQTLCGAHWCVVHCVIPNHLVYFHIFHEYNNLEQIYIFNKYTYFRFSAFVLIHLSEQGYLFNIHRAMYVRHTAYIQYTTYSIRRTVYVVQCSSCSVYSRYGTIIRIQHTMYVQWTTHNVRCNEQYDVRLTMDYV